MKQKIITPILALTIGFTALVPANARPALQADERINRELTAAAVAYEIHKKCPTIEGRMMKAMSKAMSLRSYVMGLGYSAEEVDAFVDDRAEQKRIRGLRDQYMSQNGVKKGDIASYCQLGEQEINKGSIIGSILKKK